MNKITVEVAVFPNNALAEIIPGVSIHNTTGEQLSLKVELGLCKIESSAEYVSVRGTRTPAEYVSVRGTGTLKQAE